MSGEQSCLSARKFQSFKHHVAKSRKSRNSKKTRYPHIWSGRMSASFLTGCMLKELFFNPRKLFLRLFEVLVGLQSQKFTIGCPPQENLTSAIHYYLSTRVSFFPFKVLVKAKLQTHGSYYLKVCIRFHHDWSHVHKTVLLNDSGRMLNRLVVPDTVSIVH